METKELLYQNKKLVYRTAGKGSTVVLLHGFGEDGTIWHNQFEAFPDHQLIIPDLPGSGGSEVIDDMSMNGLTEAVKAILDEASSFPGGAVLIGHSMGGYVTLAYAEKYSEAVSAFGLFHSTAYADSDEKKEARKKGIDVMEEKGGPAFLQTSVPNLYAQQTKTEKPWLIAEQLEGTHNFSGAALVNYYEAMMERPDRTDVLRKAQVPVLFILGKWDTAVPLNDGLALCYLPQLSYIHILDASGHMGMIEERERANEILKAFITRP